MNKPLLFALSMAVACGGIATTVAAQQGPIYVMPKVAWMNPDIGGFDDALNLGVALGYDFSTTTNGVWSVEGEFTTTVSDGNVVGGGDWDVDTLAGYGTYRSSGDLYWKGKAGFQRFDIKRAGGTAGPIPTSKDTEFAVGIGGGFRMDRGAGLEIEYAHSSELAYLSAGYYWRF